MRHQILMAVPMAACLLFSPTLHGQSLGDAQIAHIAVTANQLDITAAELALEKSSHSEVRRFAETMIRDHKGVIEQAAALADRLGVTPTDNELSRSLTTQAEETLNHLQSIEGASFDRAYIENEVAYHETVITAVAETLIPSASHPDLRQLLRDVLPALRAHLDHARHVQEDLPLDDAVIAHIAVTANELDITAAEQALQKSSHPEVRRFAQTMVRDHRGVIEQAAGLAGRLGLTPVDNHLSRSLEAQASDVRERLGSLQGVAFDRAYIEHEVTYHAAVIATVRDTLIPNAANAELRALLEGVVPALEAHLNHARQVGRELRNR